MRAKTEAYLREKLAVSIPGGRLVRDLSTAERKLVQIARALIDGRGANRCVRRANGAAGKRRSSHVDESHCPPKGGRHFDYLHFTLS